MFLVVARARSAGVVFGYFAFRSRIKGVYFSIITQALTFATMLLFFRNETGFGGNNGFTDFKRILGIPDHHAQSCAALFVFTGPRCSPPCCWPASSSSKLGRVLQAIRDAESRVMFSGYNPLVQALRSGPCRP
jgi:urea transport system permease protein